MSSADGNPGLVPADYVDAAARRTSRRCAARPTRASRSTWRREPDTRGLSYTATGEGPTGWTVDVTLTGQAQAVSGTVKAGGTSNVAVKVTPADNAEPERTRSRSSPPSPAKQYPIELERRGHRQLLAHAVHAQRRSFGARPVGQRDRAGLHDHQHRHGAGDQRRDDGDACRPTGRPSSTRRRSRAIEPGQPVNVTAKITPVRGRDLRRLLAERSRPRGAEANDSAEIRFTVEASLVGALIGAAPHRRRHRRPAVGLPALRAALSHDGLRRPTAERRSRGRVAPASVSARPSTTWPRRSSRAA